MGEQTSAHTERRQRQISYWSRDLKTRDHFYYLKRFLKMEQIKQSRGKLELLAIGVIGGCLMYYGAIALNHCGLWCYSEYHQLKNNFRSWVMQWDSGPIQITLEETKNGGGIVLANEGEVKDYDEAINYLFVQSQEFAKCKARLGEIKTLIPADL